MFVKSCITSITIIIIVMCCFTSIYKFKDMCLSSKIIFIIISNSSSNIRLYVFFLLKSVLLENHFCLLTISHSRIHLTIFSHACLEVFSREIHVTLYCGWTFNYIINNRRVACVYTCPLLFQHFFTIGFSIRIMSLISLYF